MSSELMTTFLSALQASASVLLTISVGVMAAQFGVLNNKTARHISSMCVNICLPCLLLVNIGSELSLGTAMRFVPILIWGIIYCALTLFLSKATVVLFGLPQWTVAAVTFNNTTSLPLLLLQSLEATGALSVLGGENVLSRLRSYFLLFAVVVNVLTFGEGPQTMRGFREEAFPWAGLLGLRKHILNMVGHDTSVPDEESQQPGEESDESEQEEDDSIATPATPLLPNRVIVWERRTTRAISSRASRVWDALPTPVQKVLKPLRPFINQPTIGAMLGAIIGLTPALHRLFFNQMEEGGYFKAWLTTTLKNVGELFVNLQVIVVGVELSLSLRKMKKGEAGGEIPFKAKLYVLLTRFFVLPAISIPLIWAVAHHTNLLNNDRALWFAMMLMPVGPPAMKLLALANVSNLKEDTKMSISKLLTMAYLVTPLISFSVVGALKAATAVDG